ncbi:MAG: MFS transporter [Planctomycetota bacterium]|nr:MFS transporter [Planctomycetota bacterium]
MPDAANQERVTTHLEEQPIWDGRPTRVRWVVLALVSFASASAYLTRYCISAANTTIQPDLGFDDEQMGRIMSAFALGYLFCQVPGGWLGNRFGTRLAFAGISFLWSLCNLWSGIVSTFYNLWASRFALGVFQAGLTPLSGKILQDWIPLHHRGKSSSWIGASMSLGGAFTLWFTGWLLQRDYGWRVIFNVYSIVGILWAIGFYWFFRTFPREHASVNGAELKLIEASDEKETIAIDQSLSADLEDSQAGTSAGAVGGSSVFWNMLSSASMWALSIQSFFRAAGYAFFVTWFFAFLEYAYGIGKLEAGFYNSLPLVAVVVGSLAGGLIVDFLWRTTNSKWISRSGTASVALFVCAVFTFASTWTGSAPQLATVIAVGALFSGIGSPAAWAATIDMGGRHTAIVMGTMNMAGCVAGVVLPIVLGSWFSEIRKTGGNWDPVIYLHVAFYLCAAVSWLFVNPNVSLDTEPA